MRLIESLNAWGTPEFDDVLKRELAQADAEALPLQQGLASGSYALGERRSAMVIASADQGSVIRAKVGIFYNAVIAGCSCADDPTPVDELNEYCVLQLDIDKRTAEAVVTLLAD